jgi:hypothetical protein
MIVSMPATALPAGVTLVIVGCGRYVALGLYKLMFSGFEQPPRKRSPRAARRMNDVVFAKGYIAVPVS